MPYLICLAVALAAGWFMYYEENGLLRRQLVASYAKNVRNGDYPIESVPEKYREAVRRKVVKGD